MTHVSKSGSISSNGYNVLNNPSFFTLPQKYKPLMLWGCFNLLTYLVLAWYSGLSEPLSIAVYLGILLCSFLGYGGFSFYCFKQKIDPCLWLIVFFAIIFHVIGIFANPQFEDDYFRYLWDGYIFFEQGNPYIKAPSEYFTDDTIPFQYQNLLNQINYPDIKTIYSPLLQYSFWLSHYFFPADILGLKIIVSLCNIGIILILAKMVSTRYVLLYAWNPLLIKEIAFTAHPDVIGVLFLMLAVLFISSRPKTAAIFLGISVCSKPFAWLIAIYYLLRFNLKQWGLFFSSILILYFPFLLDGSLFSGISAFGNNWEFNAGLYSLFTFFLSPLFSKILVVIILFGVMIYCYAIFRSNKAEQLRGDLLIGCLLLLSPVINPWYLVWLLPFATLHFSLWPWVMSFALLLSYFSGINLLSEPLQAYELASWVKPIEFSLIFLAIIYDLLTKKKCNNQDRK